MALNVTSIIKRFTKCVVRFFPATAILAKPKLKKHQASSIIIVLTNFTVRRTINSQYSAIDIFIVQDCERYQLKICRA